MLLNTRGISKQFNGVYALQDVNLEVEKGEVHGLVGENGAGKSTLIKILTGVYSLDRGEVFFEGKKVEINDPLQSRAVGINVIHQDHVLVPAFTAVENIYLGREYPRKHGRIDWKTMQAEAEAKAAELGIELDFKHTAAKMSPPQRTCVEIVRAMMTECRLLILDEPTASLTNKEADVLFAIIGRLKEKGVSVLYISHRMDEIFRLTDRITVLRNGRLAGVVDTAETDKDALIRMMTDNYGSAKITAKETITREDRLTTEENTKHEGGSDLSEAAAGQVLLQAEHIATADGIVKDVSFESRRGEIFGIFGLGGSGRTELLECLYGYRKKKAGTIRLDGKTIEKSSPADSIKNGIALICEDRRGKALIMNKNVRENISLPRISSFAKTGIMQSGREKEHSQGMITDMEIKTTGTEQPVKELSGGNQQKVVFAKALGTDPKLWLCDEPTQAVDVRTRGEIHRLLKEKAREGCSVVLVTSDLKEMLEVADRIMILSDGKSGAIMENKDLTAEQVLAECFIVNGEPPTLFMGRSAARTPEGVLDLKMK